MSYDYDLIVIGAGPAGLSAAKRAAFYGASVALIEENRIGGTCLNQGCIAEKLFSYAAKYAELYNYAAAYGWEGHLLFNWSKFIEAKEKELANLNQIHFELLKQTQIEYLLGSACFIDEHTISINQEKRISANKILIASGSKPIKPQITGIEYAIDTAQLFSLKTQPKTIAIVGSNYIAVKLAQILNCLGSKIIQVFKEEHILPKFDNDLSQRLQLGMAKRGIQIWNKTKLEKINLQNDGLKVELNGIAKNTLKVEAVICITERIPSLKKLNLNKLDLEVNHCGRLVVDSHYQTKRNNIFAIGDCIEKEFELTPTAIAEGCAFADNQFGNKNKKVNYNFIPINLSYFPEAASIGLSEANAREQILDSVKCYYKEFKPLFHSISNCEEKTFIKLIVNSRTEKVLAIHFIGQSACEIVQSLGTALKQGITIHDLNSAIGIHPSIGEEFFSFF